MNTVNTKTSLNFQPTKIQPSNQYGGFSSAQAQQQALKNAVIQSQQQHPEEWKNTKPTPLQNRQSNVITPIQKPTINIVQSPSKRIVYNNINNIKPTSIVKTISDSSNEYIEGINPQSQTNQMKYKDTSGSVDTVDTLDVALSASLFIPGAGPITQAGKTLLNKEVVGTVKSGARGLTTGLKPTTEIKTVFGETPIAVVSKSSKGDIKNVVMKDGSENLVIVNSGSVPVSKTGDVIKNTSAYVTGARIGQKIIGKKPTVVNSPKVVKPNTINKQTNLSNKTTRLEQSIKQIKPTSQLEQMDTFYSIQKEGVSGPWFSKQLIPDYAAKVSYRGFSKGNPNVNSEVWEIVLPRSVSDQYNAVTLSQPFRKKVHDPYNPNNPPRNYPTPKGQSHKPLSDFDSQFIGANPKIIEPFPNLKMDIYENEPIGDYVNKRTFFKTLTASNEWVFPIEVVQKYGKKIASTKEPTKFLETIQKTGTDINTIRKTGRLPNTNTPWDKIVNTANKRTRLNNYTPIKAKGKLPTKSMLALPEKIKVKQGMVMRNQDGSQYIDKYLTKKDDWWDMIDTPEKQLSRKNYGVTRLDGTKIKSPIKKTYSSEGVSDNLIIRIRNKTKNQPIKIKRVINKKKGFASGWVRDDDPTTINLNKNWRNAKPKRVIDTISHESIHNTIIQKIGWGNSPKFDFLPIDNRLSRIQHVPGFIASKNFDNVSYKNKHAVEQYRKKISRYTQLGDVYPNYTRLKNQLFDYGSKGTIGALGVITTGVGVDTFNKYSVKNNFKHTSKGHKGRYNK